MCSQLEKCEACSLNPCGKTTCSRKRVIGRDGKWVTVPFQEYLKIREQEERLIKNGAIPMNFYAGSFMYAGVSKK